MKKVLCIDDSELNVGKIKVGNFYTAMKSRLKFNVPTYYIKEAGDHYAQERFSDCSEIDETEMTREYNLTPEKLKVHSISWYTKRLSEETRIEARSFIRQTLYFLRKKVEV